MKVSDYTLSSAYDGLSISVLSVCPDAYPKAVVQLAHGMCGSKERFLAFMKYLAQNGIACFANDHRGHGESIMAERDRGYMFEGVSEALVDDMRMLTENIREQYPEIPLFLLGHSMGSMAARAYLKQYPDALDGVIICGSPSYNPLAPVGYAFLSAVCLCGCGRLRPKILQSFTSAMYNRRFASEGPQAWVCSDPEVRRIFLDDPRHNFVFTFNASRALLSLMLQSYSSKGWKKISSALPVLFLYGSDDPCAGGTSGIGKAASVLQKAGYRHISIKTYPAMRHEILNEIGKERVWRDILEFIGQ